MYNDDIPYVGRDNLPPERTPQPVAPNPAEQEMNGRARIKVIGVGGAGNNAVNRMIDAGITSAEYVAVNTDAQILACSRAKTKIQIGSRLTKGLGAGADPDIGRAAAEENKDDLVKAVEKTDLLFITAGMGGGTGTGAAPVLAKIAKDLKILTVAVVTEPFSFEGKRRMDNTIKGIDNLRKYVDTLIIIPNEKIGDVVPKNAPMAEALRVADEVLKQGIRGIADLIVTPALINLDFADVRAVLKDKGLAHMGVGVAKGENRIVDAVRLAVNCPLLETTIEGATGVILNVVGGNDLTFDEVKLAASLIHSVVDYSANIIFGACIDENISDEVEVTVIATGFPAADKTRSIGMQQAVPQSAQSARPAAEFRQVRSAGATVQPQMQSQQQVRPAGAPPVQPQRTITQQQSQQQPRTLFGNNASYNQPANNPMQTYSDPAQGGYRGYQQSAQPQQPAQGYYPPQQGMYNSPQQQPQQGYYNRPQQSAQNGYYGGEGAQGGYAQPDYSAQKPGRQYPPAVSPDDVAVDDDDEYVSESPRDQKLPPFVQKLLGKKK